MQQLRRSGPRTILLKAVMAVTGVILVAYLVTHVAANLTIFSGPEKINGYAALLRTAPPLLWGARLVLLAAAVLHIGAAWKLTQLKKAARPVGYSRHERQVTSFATRTIRVGGVVLLVFLVYHILHFTIGTVHPDFQHGDVYRNVISGLSVPWVALFYIVAMGALGLHLAHGVWSAFQTLGVTNPRLVRVRQGLAWFLAVAIAGGFTLIPLAILTGFLR
jgi:succinate dehydrogenase / fumarate reductase cytochrome b subunit